MSDQLHQLLGFILEKELGIPATRAASFAGHFAEVEEFLLLKAENLKNVKSMFGKNALKFNDEEIKRILEFIASGKLSPQLTVAE
ncbi:MAG TPA: hypothetical protein VK211_25535, partial [Kamptonema sp.]|nr:hypothetical protein [Kamptonema sp.]